MTLGTAHVMFPLRGGLVQYSVGQAFDVHTGVQKLTLRILHFLERRRSTNVLTWRSIRFERLLVVWPEYAKRIAPFAGSLYRFCLEEAFVRQRGYVAVANR
jgi:hypothetical protein